MIILAGSSNPKLAKQIANHLSAPLAKVDISKFPNGEKRIWVKSKLKDKVVAIIQSFSEPVDEHIIEFTLLADAAHHLGAKKIIAVIPWFGYSPQDKEFNKGMPVSAHVVARIIECIGVDHLITVDIHSQDTLNFFTIPVTEISSASLFANHFKPKNLQGHVVVSVDKGSRARSQSFANNLNLPLVLFDKKRLSANRTTLKLIKGDIKSRSAIAIDDFVSTGSTRIGASKILKSKGLVKYTDCITHALLASDSSTKLQQSQIDQIITTNTYLIPKHKRFPKLKVLSIAPLIAQALETHR